MAERAHPPLTTDPKRVVCAYLLLTFALSSIFWDLIMAKPQFAVDSGILRHVIFLLMWCPAVAAVATRLFFQRNLDGFGFKIGELRWWVLAALIPIAYGLVMFGTGWITGIAPFLTEKATAILALPVLEAILIAICSNIISATGEGGGVACSSRNLAGLRTLRSWRSSRRSSGSAGMCRSCSPAATRDREGSCTRWSYSSLQ